MPTQHDLPRRGWRHYFAFGSNMDSQRLRERIPQAKAVGAGRLSGWAFLCNKIGIDGSAKANIVRQPGSAVWGVVYALPDADLPRLDAIEGGYERLEVEIATLKVRLLCDTYASARVTNDPTPFAWYKKYMLDGASEHGLPPAHIAMLRALPERPGS